MAIGFRTSGMFGKPPMPQQASLQQPMPIGVQQMQQPAKPKFFGEGGVGRAIAGSIGDFLLQNSGMQPIYAPSVLQQRDAAERERMAQQQQQRQRENFLFEEDYKRANPTQPQPTEFERMLAASGLPKEQQILLMQDYVRNRANPVQGVPFTDEQGNAGIQFIRPNAVQQPQGLIPIGGTLPPKGGSGGNVTGGFPSWY